MTRPRVSVILPAYNAERFLPISIGSVLDQTERQFELIVVDDCSSDATAAIAAAYAQRDPRVRLLQMPRNGGPAAARNTGLDAAQGDWIALLDADDRYRPTRLRTLLDLGDAESADVVADNLLLHFDNEPPAPLIEPGAMPEARLLTAAEFIAGNLGGKAGPRFTYGLMHPVFRRPFLERFGLRYDERNRFGEDYMLYVSSFRAGARWWVTPEMLYDYTVRAGSLTEVQTSGDLRRIVALERGYLSDASAANVPKLRAALRRHVSKVRRLYAYRAFTDALKQRQLRQAAKILAEHHAHAGSIVRETMRQAPLIVHKAVAGGYGRRARAVPTSKAVPTSNGDSEFGASRPDCGHGSTVR